MNFGWAKKNGGENPAALEGLKRPAISRRA